ncbi:MAG: ABC transporter ATP-binding protein [Chloroflexi bacterium]|nr:ABC transporter ATP-binding protein [Chloroflexota bacterium]
MLVVDNLHFAYKDTRILNGLYLDANEGELVGIVGPNGAGKSTLLRLISGVLKAAEGRVSVNGTDLASLKPAQRARLVSVVPQNPQLPLHFKLLDLVLMGRNPHLRLMEWEGGRDLEISRKAMELTDTWRLADRLVGTLSGGERQRGVVAMALAQEAPVLLLDEPTSSLDLAHQTGIMDLVRDVQRQRGGTIVVAMHDLTLAAQYSDRLIMLAEGRSYAEGSPKSVLTRENISRVYGTNVVVLEHPIGGTPVVLPISNERHMGNNLNGQQSSQR